MRDLKMVNGREARVMAICIDAMSLDYIRPHLARLPTFKSLLETGALKTLATTADPLTASIWASFATGDGPGAHGHYFPFQWDPEIMTFERTASSAWSERLGFDPFWYDLARRGVPCIVLDPGTPHTSADAPPTEIVNWSYQSSGAASATNPQLLAEIRRRFGRRPIGKEVLVPKSLGQSRRIRDDLIAAIEAKADAALWLMDREDWRFFLTGFYEMHRAGHNLLVVEGDYGSEADPDALLAVYEAQDRALAKLIEKAADESVTVILFSLHGMVPNWSQEHFAGQIMERLSEAWHVKAGGAPRPPRKENLMTRIRAAVPARIQYSLAYLLGEKIQDWVVNRSLIGGLDWSRTPAFRIASGGEGYIRLNIKGRERDGYLEPGEVAGFVAWLKERLFEIRVSPSGKPLVRDVLDMKTLFPGDRAEFLPDLVVAYAPDEPAPAIESPVIGLLEAHLGTGRGGNHAPHAFMIVAGAGKSSSALADVADIRDIRMFIETLLLEDNGAAPAARSAAPSYADA